MYMRRTGEVNQNADDFTDMIRQCRFLELEADKLWMWRKPAFAMEAIDADILKEMTIVS